MPNACGGDTDDDMAEDELDVVPHSAPVPDLEGGCEDEISDDEDGLDHKLLLGAYYGVGGDKEPAKRV
jgi:hypothetical protein